MGLNPWKTKRTRIAFETPWFRIQDHEVTRPDGKPGQYSYMEVRPSVCVLALNDRDEVALVGQWRYPIGSYTWELIRGGSDEGETEILEVAKRELLEETGFQASHWTPMGDAYTCTGLTTDRQYFFAATGLRFVGNASDTAEPLDLRWVSFSSVLQMVTSGDIVDVCTVTAIFKFERLRDARP